jgi:hypothetical protein
MGAMCFDPDLMAMRPIVAPVPGDLVINEFLADPTIVTDANGEWFELTVINPVDLNDLKIHQQGQPRHGRHRRPPSRRSSAPTAWPSPPAAWSSSPTRPIPRSTATSRPSTTSSAPA